MKRYILILALFFLVLFWMARYTIYPAICRTATVPIAYKLDRWTGKVTVYFGEKELQTE